ncbi:cytochrome c-type biogenesis protein CcmB [Solidesulfovibrio fructosivorans JJ]]|uniref:Cytochrome c-type biogenesis protein CcmB n=1 Tax=Solidesulfovibrio fructosivorans JJ] TaxID=596151 RepID=E1JWN1_SOLFR|nr:heme exporter protein CcmB [Solidesulfovibrio fructosivorans]EFL51328.1 cytochrome c-type biogenesis protein CcmB [Solidesulfovibrio fructosivorans JJ]]
MLKAAVAIAKKDLSLSLSGAQGLVQTVLLGLLLIFIMSLSREPGEMSPPLAAAAVFWLATAFGQVLVFNFLYSLEEAEGARLGLLLAPCPVQAVWLGKAVAGWVLLFCCQMVFAPAAVAFLGQHVVGSLLTGLVVVAAVDWGLCALGSLLGALAVGRSARESLLTVILFPLLVPVLLAGIRLLETVISGRGFEAVSAWAGTVGAFDAVFTAAALVLFPFLYTGEE